MSWGPDGSGVNGVYLGKNVVTCAGGAIEAVVRQVSVQIWIYIIVRTLTQGTLNGALWT